MAPHSLGGRPGVAKRPATDGWPRFGQFIIANSEGAMTDPWGRPSDGQRDDKQRKGLSLQTEIFHTDRGFLFKRECFLHKPWGGGGVPLLETAFLDVYSLVVIMQ